MSPMGDKVRIHFDSHRSQGADYSLFFSFSRPRDTSQAASTQTRLGCWRSNTKVTPQQRAPPQLSKQL